MAADHLATPNVGGRFDLTILPHGGCQWRCQVCLCSVNPQQHKPGSSDCLDSKRERKESRRS